MGNCQREKLSEATIDKKIFPAIKSGSLSRVTSILKFYTCKFGLSEFEKQQTYHNKVLTNPLGLCLLLGNFKLFQYLLSEKCEISQMERVFQISSFKSIDYVCRHGHKEILKAYFEGYLKSTKEELNGSIRSYTMCLSSIHSFGVPTVPIHIACKNGHLDIISYFYYYFKDYEVIPLEYNIETRDENAGENCALLACRYGEFEIVKFLHEKCNANFDLVNTYNENAIIVTIASFNKRLNYTYINVLNYLVDVIKVDVKFSYQEALLLAKCKTVYQILSGRLKKQGIEVNKKDFEDVSFEYIDPSPEDIRKPIGQFFTESFGEALNSDQPRSAPSTIRGSIFEIDLKDSLYLYS